MTSISPSLVASIGKPYPKQVDYILLPDEAIAKLSPEEQAMVRNAQEGIRRAREFSASDLSKVVWTKMRLVDNQTPEQKAQLYRRRNSGGGLSFLKPTKFESKAADFANVKGIPANELDDRISFIANSIKKGAFKGMEFHSANGDQLTTSPQQYLQWLKEAKASVVQFEGYA